MGSFEETFQSRIDAWVDDLSNKTPPEKVNASAEDALEVQRVIEAAIQSWANGSVVDLKKMDWCDVRIIVIHFCLSLLSFFIFLLPDFTCNLVLTDS